MKKVIFKQFVFSTILSLFIISCSEDTESKNNDTPIAKGESFYITLKTKKEIGSIMSIEVGVPYNNKKEHLKGVWIDANGNGKRDVDEGVSKTNSRTEVVLGNQTIRIYGKVIVLKCDRQEIVELDVSTNPALYQLDCRDNLDLECIKICEKQYEDINGAGRNWWDKDNSAKWCIQRP